jgi:hypothetical protein
MTEAAKTDAEKAAEVTEERAVHAAIEAFVKTFARELGLEEDEAIVPLANTEHEHRSLAVNTQARLGVVITVTIKFSQLVNVAEMMKPGASPKGKG